MEKFVTKGKIFEVVFLDVLSYKIHTFDVYKTTYLSPSTLDGKSFVNECMYA